MTKDLQKKLEYIHRITEQEEEKINQKAAERENFIILAIVLIMVGFLLGIATGIILNRFYWGLC